WLMPSQLLRRGWFAIAIGTFIAFRTIMQKDGMPKNWHVLDFHPGIVAVQSGQLLPATTTLAVIQTAFQGEMDVSILAHFDLDNLHIIEIQGYGDLRRCHFPSASIFAREARFYPEQPAGTLTDVSTDHTFQLLPYRNGFGLPRMMTTCPW